jgi:phosphoenolpyruvate carboxykinase (ATP)
MITAILNGSIEQSEFEAERVFGLSYPKSLSGVDTGVLSSRIAWENIDGYDRQAAELAELFVENFNTYGESVSYLLHAGPVKQNEIAI